MTELDALKRVLRKDKKLLRFKDNFEGNPNFSLNFDKLHEELERLHATRSVRTLRRKNHDFAEEVLDSMLQDQATRSRCTEILGACIKIRGALSDTLDNIRDYLIMTYSSKLKLVGGTQSERKAYVETVLRPFYKYLTEVSMLEEHCKVIIQDIDKAGFAYTNLVETIKILSAPERVRL